MLRLSFILAILIGSTPRENARDDWPMLGHDARRSGATRTEIRPPFERKWYRLFPDEGLMAGVQPVAAGGKVYAGTLAGVLHALDAETGEDIWTFPAGGPILHTCAVSGDRVFFGAADGKIYAVSGGRLLWAVQTGAAVWNAPAVCSGLVLVGSRNGKLYAVDEKGGSVRWTASTGGPLLSSPAADEKVGRVYIASEDLRIYAVDLQDGNLAWKSVKLPGVSFRGYHPVIASDGSVMVTTAPMIPLDVFQSVLLDMVKEIFGDFSSWRHSKEENERLRRENLALLEKEDTYRRELEYLRRRLEAQPAYQTFFVLDPMTGKQKFVTPIVYAESMNGTGAPPIVTPGGDVIVKFQALLRSRYQHYSPFLNVGYLDTKTGHIIPIMDQARTYGWHDSLLLVHDEQCQLSAGGRVLFNTHQDNVNAMDLETRKGYPFPLCRNIHEPKPGEAAAIWASILHKKPLPQGKEWLSRGTAVYGGGSVIDVPVSIAGDSFYYIPTHEINAGAAIIAYRMKKGGSASDARDPPAEALTTEDWQKIQEMPWDWDSLGLSRLNHLLKALPGKVPGTRQLPLEGEARKSLEKIGDEDLDRFIWEVPEVEPPRDGEWSPLQEKLSRAVRELISQKWRPFVFPPGKHPLEAYRFFNEPTGTLYTLALAYPHLEPDGKESVEKYMAELSAPGGPLEGPTGKMLHDPHSGEIRSAYDPVPEGLFRVAEEITRDRLARLYPLWLWAHVTADWKTVEESWPRMRDLLKSPEVKFEEDCRNGRIAGLIAYCRMAKVLRDASALESGLRVARKAMRERLAYEFAHTRGGLITSVPVLRTIFGRWRHLTPEVGHFLGIFAGETHRQLMKVYVDYHRPTWWLAWNVETLVRNECPYQLPSAAADIFFARALILSEPANDLKKSIDIPWCRADEYYIQKLALTLSRAGTFRWKDLRSP